MSRYLIIFLTFLISFNVQSEDKLPSQHKLMQNESGEFYVINKDEITMIEPSIIKIGYSSKWILACIKHESIDSDLKRWVFIDLKNKGTYDTINLEQWKFYRDEAYPDLKQIELKNLSEDKCP